MQKSPIQRIESLERKFCDIEKDIKDCCNEDDNPSDGGDTPGVAEIYKEITKAELDTLIAGSSLVPGLLYKVSKVHPSLYVGSAVTGTYTTELPPNMGEIVVSNLGGTGVVTNLSGGFIKTVTFTITDGTWANTTTINGTFVFDLSFTFSGGTSIIARAVSVNELDKQGVGIFYNPKYNQAVVDYGIWNNINTFVSSSVTGNFVGGELITNNLGGTGRIFGGAVSSNRFIIVSGTWVGATTITGGTSGATATIGTIALKSYGFGSTIIWGGYVWSNTSGAIGSSTNALTLSGTDWVKVPYNTTNYNIAYDPIEYDYTNDIIIKRTDIYRNVVTSTFNDNLTWVARGYVGHPISVFQWGNPYVDTTLKGTANNKILNSYAESVNWIGSFYANCLEQRSAIVDNTSYISHIRFNDMKCASLIRLNQLSSSSINNNIMFGDLNNDTVLLNTSTSAIYQNYLSASFIKSNRMNFRALISSNTVGATGYIYNNIMDFTAAINSNILNLSYIYANTLSYAATISSNTMTSSSQIRENILSGSFQPSTINSNNLSSYSVIWGNRLDRNSQINSNIMSNGDNLFFVYIYENIMFPGSRINSNTITSKNGGVMYNSFQCVSAGGVGSTSPSISSNNISGTGRISNNIMKIGSSILRATVTSAATGVNGNELTDIVYDINATLLKGLTLNQIGNRHMRFNTSIIFTGAAGVGAIGNLFLPPFQAPAGFFIKEVIVDIGTGLTAGAGAILNLGIATDNTQSGLNDTTGLISTLNTSGVTRISLSTLTKATALRLIVAETKVAAITAGTLGLTIHLEKLN